jgi:hypothetical protein
LVKPNDSKIKELVENECIDPIFNEPTNNTIQIDTHINLDIGVYSIEGCNLKKQIVVHVLCFFHHNF